MNMIKLLSWRFEQCLGTFTMLLVEWLSETGHSRHLSNNNFGNTKALRVIFFTKDSKFNVDFKKAVKNSDKVSCLLDNSIWISIVKLSLLRTGYLSWAANVLTSSARFYMSVIETFSRSISLPVTSEYDKGAVMQISTVFGHVYHDACWRVLSNRTY